MVPVVSEIKGRLDAGDAAADDKGTLCQGESLLLQGGEKSRPGRVRG